MPDKWLSDPSQLDSKRKDHPTVEFGHEPIIIAMGYNPRGLESDGAVIVRLLDKIQGRGIGSFASSTLKGRTIKAEVTELGCQVTIREGGRLIHECYC